MPDDPSRPATWARLDGMWDVLVIGGGITGAGIVREAARAGLKALLVEGHDFAWGTSSRSSKLVHGGLRYLREGQLGLVWEAVRERERLIKDAPGLVEPLHFMLPTYSGDSHGKLMYGVALAVYDIIAGCWKHTWHDPEEVADTFPGIARQGLGGGFRYYDAATDDARLVLRVLQEAVGAGAVVLNHAPAVELVREDGKVVGAVVEDRQSGARATVRAAAVVNATGVWVDGLRDQVGAPHRMRPLRGSHLVVRHERLPVAEAIAMQHPRDRRVMFVYPWQGVTVVGTTDLDHKDDLALEPGISGEEVSYLLAAVQARFPDAHIGLDDVVSTWCGVRPVVSSGKADPSAETRDHVVWDESGLITVTGGKLTTFRIIAHDAMLTVLKHLPGKTRADREESVLDVVPDDVLPAEGAPGALPADDRRWLLGRYGAKAGAVLAAATPGAGDLDHVGDTPFLWVELRWAAEHEWIGHLDDLLLRRVRVGLLLPDACRAELPRVRATCQAALGWSDARWAEEEEAWLALWARCYSLPDRAAIPPWTDPAESRQSA